MAKANSKNERIKYEYATYLAEAKRMSPDTVKDALASIALFEKTTKTRDFAAFHIEQARRFKRFLSETRNARTGKPLSKATIHSRLNTLKAFFLWLATQPGYKSKIGYSDCDYFNPSAHDTRIATARKEVKVPSLQQIKHVLSVMPTETLFEQRDRAIIAFTLLSGARDNAIASFNLGHVDLVRRTVFHDAATVRTKGRKTFTSTFFPVGDDVEQIVGDFMQNSVGIDQSAVTVDLWMARTYNRYIGRLMDVPPKQAEEGKIASDVRGRAERDTIKRLVTDAANEAGLEPSAMQAALWYFEQRLYRNLGASAESTNFSGAAGVALKKRGIDGQATESQRGTESADAAEGVREQDGSGSGREQAGEGDGDGSGREAGGSLAPLEGAPNVRGNTGPDPKLVAVAEQYARDNGVPLKRQAEYVEVDPERAARIAEAYDAMPHAPQDPAVQEAYANLIQQTLAQYRALEAAGCKARKR